VGWLITSRVLAAATLADFGDGLKKVGTYAVVGGRHRLSVSLGPSAFASFYPDRAIVVRSG
jgi:hypothetical protein